MTFEEILPALKKGNKVIRKGWSGSRYPLLFNQNK